MSYSLIKTVFPNFSTTVYDTKLYDTIENNTIESNTRESNKIENEEEKKETFINNLKFFNEPIKSLDDVGKLVENKIIVNKPTEINECQSCKNKEINFDRVKNEELMELISFIMFGIFILLLIDSNKK